MVDASVCINHDQYLLFWIGLKMVWWPFIIIFCIWILPQLLSTIFYVLFWMIVTPLEFISDLRRKKWR